MLIIKKTKNERAKSKYVKPKVRQFAIEMNECLLTGSGDPTITNPDMGWGARDNYDTFEAAKSESIWDSSW